MGASFPASDAADLKLFKELRDGTGSIVASVTPQLVTGMASHGYVDSDGDFLPDRYEELAGLDPADPSDAMRPGDCGYLNVEIYANTLVRAP